MNEYFIKKKLKKFENQNYFLRREKNDQKRNGWAKFFFFNKNVREYKKKDKKIKEEKMKMIKKLRLCLVTVLFSIFKNCFWKYKVKTIFLYFWNQKHVWLVKIKKIIFWRKKLKILKYVVTRIWTLMLTHVMRQIH